MIELKSLRPATDAEILEELKKVWHDEKMRKWSIDNFDYYVTEDGYIFELKKFNKLTIDKHLWFSDDDEIPEASFEVFKMYNEINAEKITNTLKNKTYSFEWQKGYSNINILTLAIIRPFDVACECAVRNITDDERADLINLYDERLNNYNLRLEKYWKRYGNNVICQGYWADR